MSAPVPDCVIIALNTLLWPLSITLCCDNRVTDGYVLTVTVAADVEDAVAPVPSVTLAQ